MNQVAEELQQTYPALRIQLLGVNEQGQEPGNGSITDGRDLPWLQDADVDGNGQSDVWEDLWNVTFRDVVILNGQNAKVDVYNVTQHDLSDPNNYSDFRQLLIDAAMQDQKPWQNPADPLDVDDSGYVSARDVLFIVNLLNAEGSQQLAPPTTAEVQAPFYDCNGDSTITPSDALRVINFINGVPTDGEGEASARAESSAVFVPPPPTDRSDAQPSAQERLPSASIVPAGVSTQVPAGEAERPPGPASKSRNFNADPSELDAVFCEFGALEQGSKLSVLP